PGMPTRREFLTTAASAVAAASTPAWALEGQREITSPLKGTIGLQLWSLRDVEGAGLWKQTAPDLRKALDTAGLRCQSAHMGLDRLRDDLPGALSEAKVLGATWVVCPWIAASVTRDDIMKAADVFNRAAKTARAWGMRFGYHLHGYEFVPS